ncbi:T9SS type B sorting domain-containing protein [Sabulilitoribacter multivorans]|uniref:T9SS type B sorting domain-containing protein n=1 Tax=Flaviramulus multivorans TaxID=1304750 RepID=A0ABS9IMK2_9FLAO|nr:T9SS type B sorting domain-containing protein [Flaviramulus multivorans]MCF7561777.1 T9SS type B sorting domain-containing protein [Flaviramulus multivorans]
MKKIILFAIFNFVCLSVFPQYEASNWYFGENAGIKFNLGNNTITRTSNGQLNTREGCSSISDDSGNLLFYTDGVTVWNQNHLQMQNGFGLNGDSSSTQSAIIVPKPNDTDIFYVFTVDNGLNGMNNGLNYSEIDMTLDGGLGAVITKNINLLPRCSEKITAVLKDCISKSIWVVTFASVDGNQGPYNTYHAFEVSDTGISTTSVKSTFNLFISDARGYLKLSPDGTKVASANAKDGLYIYDFDVATGILSNEQSIQIYSSNGSPFPYGVEFSPDSQLLYIHSSNDFFDQQNPNNSNDPSNHTSALVQFNLNAADIEASQIMIDEQQLYRGGLQLGPDGKIYRALSASYSQGLPYLGIIQNPNTLGLGCNYVHNAFSLSPFRSSQGLPPFIASFFNTEIDIIKNGESSSNLALCDGDSYTLTSEILPGASYIWTRDKVVLPETTYDLEVFQAGQYEVYIEPNNGDCAIEGQAFVEFNPNPDAFNHTLLQCDEDGLVDGFTTFNLTEANEDLAGTTTDRSTKFYTDVSRINEINGAAFNNTANPQTIYVEVIDDRTGCFSYSELTLSVSVTDANNAALPAVCDDDGVEDGLHLFDLSDADSLILNGLPTTNLDIAYYQTYDDALLEQNNLGTSYTNTMPYSQTIYARVENQNNCYGISEVELTVNQLPDIDMQGVANYCLNFSPATIPINAAVLNDSPNNYSYIWSTGESTYEINVNQIGTYNVTVTNANGCTKERTVTIEPSNIATFESIKVIDATANNTITVIVSGEGVYEYRLLDSNNVVVAPYQESNVFENVSPGIYTVYVKDIKNNCGVVNDKVSVIGFPKFFTPNNDGIHDTWQVSGVSEMFQPNTKVLIFNRFGKLIKELSPTGEGWDGTFNGGKLPSDDYWFSVKLQDGRIFKNHFTLKY